ncbi:macrophage mannose receptor 1-like [Mya arenaria]|uniref:macrophage mannose receptor 1-like n=1 Tax=Mya arenaria TaxID=6604 RepID=UPI0022DF4536|nr:macrophage mannose receptor 1-like [Mya arenaria]
MAKRRTTQSLFSSQSSNITFYTGCVVILLFGVYIGYADADLYNIDISCPDGWQKALNNCYLFNQDDQLTWDQARTECSLRNADLMVIRTREEMDWLNIQTEYYKTDGWWVGLHYRNIWDWVQYGGDDNLIQWRNEPDNFDNQDCCAINEFGKFSDEFCRSKLGFICNFPISRGSFCPTTNNWLMTDSACYYISPLLNNSLHLNWTQAKQFCANLMPANRSRLMAFASQDDVGTLQSLLSTYNQGVLLPWWTGLNDQATEGKYVWTDGTEANGSSIQWDVAPSTDHSQRQNCGVMYQGGSIDDVTCNKRAHYACEMSAFQGYLNLGCGSWIRGGQSCYLLGKGKLLTWNDARDACARGNAHLLKVDGSDEKAWLESQTFGSYGFWTGLIKADNSYGWSWADKSVPTSELVKWSVEPNNNGGKENCVEIHRDGLYNDLDCSARAGYICEYALTFGQQCLPGWFQCEQSCHYISPANYSLTVTWYEAKQHCLDLVSGQGPDGESFTAGRLAINDKTEQTCVNTQLATLPEGSPGYWTDLSDLAVRGIWQYSSATDNPPNINLITWVHEPNNVNGNESCAVIYEGGNYNDVNCFQKFYYICERTATTVSSSQAGLRPSWLVLVAWLLGISYQVANRSL